MLTFLNSAILFGLAAISIPILIHLFAKQKSQTVLFSSLRFLKELQREKIRRLKLRQLLLLILRTLLILLLVLAFARPTLRSRSAASLKAGAPLSAVIILDNTMSMGLESAGKRLLEQAKQRALEVLSLLRPGDELYLLYPQAPPRLAHEGPRYNPASLQELIERTELSHARTDYMAALQLADELVRQSSNLNREIYLIGDMQQSGWRFPADDGHTLLSEGTRLFLLPIRGSQPENLAVTEVALANQILEKGKVIEIRAKIKNVGATAVKNKLVHLFVDGKRVAQSVVDELEPGAVREVVFRVVPDRTGFQAGYVLLEDDDLLEDNRRYFTFRIPDEVPVLLVGNRVSDTRNLALALHPDAEMAAYIRTKQIDAAAFDDEDLEAFQVLVLSNVPRLSTGATLKLQRFLASGRGLIVFLGADVDLKNYNDGFHKKLSLPPLTPANTGSDGEQFLTFGKIDFSHPIFSGVFEKSKTVDSPHFRVAMKAISKKPLDKIISYSNGEPFLFESRYQRGRILYFTSGFLSEWSDLALRGVFAPLVNRCVSYLAGANQVRNSQAHVGEELRFMSSGEDLRGDLRMEKPGEVESKVKPEVFRGNYRVRFADTREMGIYRLRRGETILAQWAVNGEPAESEEEVLDVAEVQKRLSGQEVYAIEGEGQIAQKLQQTRLGRELWKPLAAAALLVLLVEMALFREKSSGQVTEVS